jgi:DNA-binding transcriptional MerR regulator
VAPIGIDKLYYSISEVAEMLGVETHVLRYWESEFSQLRPRKNKAGRRVYRDSDVELLHVIQRLLKEDRYTVEGARKVLNRSSREDLADSVERRQLKELRNFLERLLDSV